MSMLTQWSNDHFIEHLQAKMILMNLEWIHPVVAELQNLKFGSDKQMDKQMDEGMETIP